MRRRKPRKIVVTDEDLSLPGLETLTGPEVIEARPVRQHVAEEIRSGTSMTHGFSDRQPTRPLLHMPGRRGGKFTLMVMNAAAVARSGRVVDLVAADGMVALTWEDGEYRLTEEALTPTPWKERVQHHLDLITT